MEKLDLNIPKYIEPVLRGRYWYMVSEYLNMLKQGKKVFDLTKFKANYLNYNSDNNKLKDKWQFLTAAMIRFEECGICIFVLKYLYAKCLKLFTELKSISKKLSLDTDKVVSHQISILEKYIFDNNLKYVYSQAELIQLIMKFKEVFREDKDDSKGKNLLTKFNKKKLITQLAQSPFFNGYVQNDLNNKETAEKKNQAISSLIKKDNSLNFIFGRLNTFFKKNDILIEDETKVVEGKYFTIYSLEKRLKTISAGQYEKGKERLSDLLDKRNSYYFPSDNEKFRSKMFTKISHNASNSQTLSSEVIEKINQKYKKLSFMDMIVKANKQEKSGETTIRKQNLEKMEDRESHKSLCFLNAKKESDSKQSMKNIHKPKTSSKKCSTNALVLLFPKKEDSNTISLKFHQANSTQEGNTASKKSEPVGGSVFSFFNISTEVEPPKSQRSGASPAEPQSIIELPLESICNDKKVSIYSSSSVNAKSYCLREMLIQQMIRYDNNNKDGVEELKKKIFRLNKDFTGLSKKQLKNKNDEISDLLYGVKMKRRYLDQEHSNLLHIIKKGGKPKK